MLVVAEPGVVIVPVTGPLICVQVPVPADGVLPAIVTEPVVVQMVWSGPAFDTVGEAVNVMDTSSVLAAQGAFAIVHLNVYTPVTETVTLVLAKLELLKLAVPGPLTSVQVPAPTVGALPASVAVKPHTLASGPALEAVGGAFTTIDT